MFYLNYVFKSFNSNLIPNINLWFGPCKKYLLKMKEIYKYQS